MKTQNNYFQIKPIPSKQCPGTAGSRSETLYSMTQTLYKSSVMVKVDAKVLVF